MLKLLLFIFLILSFEAAKCQDLRYLRTKTRKDAELVEADEVTPAPLCKNGEWSEWTEFLPCNRDCGACGTRVLQRTCQTESSNCPCEGASRKEEVCNINVCHYPHPACCPPYQLAVIESHFACGPQSDEVQQAFLASLQTPVAPAHLTRNSGSTLDKSKPLPRSRRSSQHSQLPSKLFDVIERKVEEINLHNANS